MRVYQGQFAAVALLIAYGVVTAGCTQIPALDGAANVPVSSVVQRIKCDLVQAIRDKVTEPDPNNPKKRTTRFDFLEHWAAKVHLTIVVDDTFALTPGATLNSPLHNAYPNVGPSSLGGTTIAAVQQSFSLGLGAGFTTEAVRQEDIEFFLSLSELVSGEHAVKLSECDRATNGVLLESDLRLGEVFDAALQPVRNGILVRGPNTGPAATPPPIPAGEIDKLLNAGGITKPTPPNAKDLKDFLENPRGPNPLAPYKSAAVQLEVKAQALINNVVKPLVDTATAFTCLKQPINAPRYAAIANSAQVTIQKIAVDNAVDNAKDPMEAQRVLDEETKYEKAVEEQTKNFVDALSDCLANFKPEKKAPVEYDPIDVISQQVNFYITVTGNVTPSWKLVRTSGPTTPMFTATRKDTNTLIIALGRPTTTPDGSVVASTPMNNAILAAILGQAITNAPPR
jgi:hypothetical protein